MRKWRNIAKYRRSPDPSEDPNQIPSGICGIRFRDEAFTIKKISGHYLKSHDMSAFVQIKSGVIAMQMER